MKYDSKKHIVQIDGKEVKISGYLQTRMFEWFYYGREKAYSVNELMEEIDMISTRSVVVTICMINRKLGFKFIKSKGNRKGYYSELEEK